jgi:pimeloyl-ACP methyl ester carboxylesterase
MRLAWLITFACFVFAWTGQAAPGGALEEFEQKVTHDYTDSGGVKIHHASIGQGPLVVMLHGFPDYWMSWWQLMRVLGTNYQVVAIDLRGYNLSDKPSEQSAYGISQLTGDVQAVIRHFNRTNAIVVGHDWGGAIAWTFAMAHPEMVQKLIVLNLPHPRGLRRELTHNPQQQTNSAYARLFQTPDAHEKLTAEGLTFWLKDGQLKSRYVVAFKRSDFRAMLNYYKQNYPKEPYTEDTSPVVKVKCPVLMIHGLKDEALLPGALNDTWQWLEQDLTLVTIPEAGHFVHHDAPEKVIRAITAWLGK